MKRYLQSLHIKKALVVGALALFLGGQSRCVAHMPQVNAAALIDFRNIPTPHVLTLFFTIGLSAKLLFDYIAEQMVAIDPTDQITAVRELFYPDSKIALEDSKADALSPYAAFNEAVQTSAVRALSVGFVEAFKQFLSAHLSRQGLTAQEISPALNAYTAGAAITLLKTVGDLSLQVLNTLVTSIFNDESSMFFYRLIVTGTMVAFGAALGVGSYNFATVVSKVAGKQEAIKKAIERFVELMLVAAFVEGLFIFLTRLYPDSQEAVQVLPVKNRLPCQDHPQKVYPAPGSNGSFEVHKEWCQNIDPILESIESARMSSSNMTISLPKKDLEGTIAAARLGINYYKGVLPKHSEFVRNLGLMTYIRSIRDVRHVLSDRS